MQYNQLMEGFIFRDLPNANSRDFNQRIQAFLNRIPNNFGQYTQNFFTGLFMGALYHFEYTEKKKQLETSTEYIRSFYQYDHNDPDITALHIIFVTDKSTYLRSVAFSKDNKLLAPKGDVKSKIDRSDLLKDLSFSQKSVASIYYKNQDGFIWEEQPRVTKPRKLPPDNINELILKLTEKEFIEIKPLPLTELLPKEIDENQVKNFGTEDIRQVEASVKTYLTGSKKIYQQALPNFKHLFGENYVNKEAFSHGFLYGGLGFNQRLYIYPERIVGSGRIDIMLTSPLPPNPIPILIEDKARSISATQGINQVVTSYADTSVPTRGFQEQGIIAAFNYDLRPTSDRQLRSDEITVRTVPIKPVNQIMATFFKICNENRPDRDNQLQSNLKHLYRTRYGIKDIRDYFALLVGHTISFKEEQTTLNKCVFLWRDPELYSQYGILVIDRSVTNGNKEQLIFDLRPSVTHHLRSHGNSSPEKKADLVIQFLTQEARQKRIPIHHFRILIDISQKGSAFFNTLEVNPVLHISAPIHKNILAGSLVSLHSVEFNSLFSFNGQRYTFQQEELKEALDPIRLLIDNEAHAQALFQGIVSGLPKEEDIVIRFFGESNHSGNGRADGIVKLGKLLRNKIEYEALSIFELKYTANANIATLKKLSSEALRQGEDYARDLKSISMERKVEIITLVIGGNKQLSKADFLVSDQKFVKVTHPSTDEEQSPPKRMRCRRNVSGNCIEYSLQDVETEKEVIKELLEARERGDVILIADEYALFILTNLREETHYFGKLIIVSEEPKRLQLVRSIIGSITQFQDIETWLQSVKNDFPKIGNLLAQKKDLINFLELKSVLSSEQKPLFKVINKLAEGENFASLGISRRIAAIYLGDNQLPSEYYALANDPNSLPVLYKKTLSESSTVIQIHHGSLDYLNEVHLGWEQEKKHSNDLILKETLVTLKLAESFFSSVTQALEKAGLDKRIWMPILDSAEKITHHTSRLLFLNLHTQETHAIDLNIAPINEFHSHLTNLYKKLSPNFALGHAEENSHLLMPESAEAIDGLNSAFLLQTLLAWSKQKDQADFNDLRQVNESAQLSKWIEIHSYISLAQMGQVAILDVTKIVGLVKTLLIEEQTTLKSSLSIFRGGLASSLNEGLGILFGGANVVMDIGELTTATTEAQRAEFSTQLAFDTGVLSLTIGASIASLLGATTTAGVLGAIATPITGLGIGITALVRNFERIVANAQAVGNYFYQLNDAYRQGGYQKQTAIEDNFLMAPLDGAVIKEINFQTNTLHYGNSYLYRSQTKSGSGKINYIFWAGYFPQVIYDKQQAFSIRERLGYAEVKVLSENFKSIKSWILPATPESYMRYDWQTLPFATGRHDRGFSILRQLEEREDFHYDFYIFPSEYIIASITPELVATTFKIILDSAERILIVPKFPSKAELITKHLNYILEGPATSGRVVIHLHKTASLKLASHHADYTWVLICDDCLGISDIRFTHTGVNIHGIGIEILSSTLGNYCFYSNNALYKLDLITKRVILFEVNADGILNNTNLINSYLENNPSNAPENLLIKIDNYPIKNSANNSYNGTAFYSSKEDHYFYTQGLPVKEMLAVNSSTSVSSRLQINFIGCIEYLCYFWSSPCYLWSSNRNTHAIVRSYYLDTPIKTASILVDNSIHIETSMEIYSVKFADQFERYITYYLKPDSKFYLVSLSDSNDHLLHLFEHENGKVFISRNISHLVAEDWEVKESPEELPNPDQQEWGGIREHFAYQLNQFVSILPSSHNTSYTPQWIRTQDENNYELINPKIQEKNLLCLGSLLMKNGTEVFYFYKPGSAFTDYKITPKSESISGKLFLKSNEEMSAKALDLPILSAFRSHKSIFVVTIEHLIEELDAFGRNYLTAITSDWITSHAENWWTEIPTLVNNSSQVRGPISIYGLHDQTGNSLGAWYDDKTRSFRFTQPPLQEDDKQFSISYLTTQGGLDFFFCLENGILYQGKSYSNAVNEIFNATQLKIKLPALFPLVTSLKTVFIQNNRWIIETRGGELFSSALLSANSWYLEKIGKQCFYQCGIANISLSANRRPANNPYNPSLFNSFRLNEIFFNRNCLNDFNETHAISSDINPTPRISFCSINNFKEKIIGQENAPCITANPNKPIPFEFNQFNHWWFPQGNHYFFNSHKKITASAWIYLGLCKQTENQTSGACFFSKEERMIYFATRESQGSYRDRIRTKMPVEFAQKQGKNHFLLVIKIDRLKNPNDRNEYFIPLLEGVKTIGLLAENATPNFPYKIPQEILKNYETIFYQSDELLNIVLYFPCLINAYSFQVERKGADIVLIHPNFISQWVFVKGMEVNAFNKTSFYIKNAKIIEKTLQLQNNVSIETPSSDFETIENIRRIFLQQNETTPILNYKIAVTEDLHAAQNHYQSAQLTLEQPEVKVQKNQASIDKEYGNTNYFWWISTGIITSALSVTALITCASHLFIRRLHASRERSIPLAIIGTEMVISPLFQRGAQAQEISEISKQTELGFYTEFSVERNCIKSESTMGMLGICLHKKRIIVWQQNYIGQIVNFENNGQWALDINKINQISLEEILPLLPIELHRRLAKQEVYQQAFIVWQKQMLITTAHYVGNVLILHTPLGNVFKTIGLSPNWRERDDVHFLGRCWITTQQLLSHQTYSEKLLSLSAGILEVALLHPRTQPIFAHLTNNRDFSKAKSVVRFIGDLLQLGLYNLSYLARLLEFWFPNNESIWKISFGIRIASHFYMLTGDLSYWYLGMALFVLPYLPSLLENFGIPVTRGCHKLSNQLAQLFIAQSLLNQFSVDKDREEQLTQELALADERVRKGEKRVKNFLATPWCSLWKETKLAENPSENNTLQVSTNLR